MSDFERIQSLIKDKAEAEARLSLIPYDGSPEIKENRSGKYLYIRKRIAGKLSSKYVDVYSDDLSRIVFRYKHELPYLRRATTYRSWIYHKREIHLLQVRSGRSEVRPVRILYQPIP